MKAITGFLVNARASTLVASYVQRSQCSGYLFPPDATTTALTNALKSSRYFKLSDDGAFDDIGKIVATTKHQDIDSLVTGLAIAAAGLDTNAQLATQLAVRPSAVVGPENVTVAAWLRAGLGDAELRPLRQKVARINAAVARRSAELATLTAGVPCLPVASAFDYDTAHDAGLAFAQTGLQRASMGFGAYMADDGWVSDYQVRGHIRKLPRRLPARYLRAALVARGFFDGWRAGTGRTLKHFHFLGLGAPIMLPLALLAAADADITTFDATSPIQDAADGSIYVSVPASLTVRTWKVAARIATEAPDTGWTCPCWFCGGFAATYPFNWKQARDLLTDDPAPKSKNLRSGARLAEACPLFRIGTDPLATAAQDARIGHNHWVVGSLTKRLAVSRPLSAAVEQQVSKYVKNAGTPQYGQAVDLALQIVHPAGVVI